MKTAPPKYPPRPGDLSRQALADMANEEIVRYGGPDKCHVNFKFTCSHCGTRCTLVEPNTLYEEGVCAACGQSTTITYGGLALHLKL
jgi:hypothetical protein